MNLSKIGQFISRRRMAMGLTQAQLAERLNVTDKAVSKWERGKSLPDVTLFSLLYLYRPIRPDGSQSKVRREAHGLRGLRHRMVSLGGTWRVCLG